MVALLGQFIQKLDEGLFAAPKELFHDSTVSALITRGFLQFVADGTLIAPTTKGILAYFFAARKPTEYGPSPFKDIRQMPLPLENNPDIIKA